MRRCFFGSLLMVGLLKSAFPETEPPPPSESVALRPVVRGALAVVGAWHGVRAHAAKYVDRDIFVGRLWLNASLNPPSLEASE